ncbi:hypothetical protein ACWC1D_02015 [Streptomyces sp. NPDC001478]
MNLDTHPAALPARAPGGTTGVRLYTRGGIRPEWLRSAVLPAVRMLEEELNAPVLYLRRGWLHGPHVDVVARPPGGEQGAVLPWDEVARLLDAGSPAPEEQQSEEEYLARAREFGRLERVEPPYLPMHPHGRIEWLDAARTATWPEPMNALCDLALTRINRPLTAAVAEAASGAGTLPTRVAEAMVALAGAHHSGLAFGVFSLRSHAEAFLAWAAPRKDVRPVFARRLAEDAPLMRSLVRQALEDSGGPAAARWRQAFQYGMGVFDSAVAQGALTLRTLEEREGGFDRTTMGPPGQEDVSGHRGSDFHTAVNASGAVAATTDWFASYRLLINLFYQQLLLLDVAPLHRYYLCYAIAETVDEVLGESWNDRLSRAAAGRSAGTVA